MSPRLGQQQPPISEETVRVDRAPNKDFARNEEEEEVDSTDEYAQITVNAAADAEIQAIVEAGANRSDSEADESEARPESLGQFKTETVSLPLSL